MVRPPSPSSCRATPSFNEPLSSVIEADTTYAGGKEKNKHAHKKTPGSQGGANKEVVLDIVERDGELRAGHVPNCNARTLQGAVRVNVAKGRNLKTDEDTAFSGLGKDYNNQIAAYSETEARLSLRI